MKRKTGWMADNRDAFNSFAGSIQIVECVERFVTIIYFCVFWSLLFSAQKPSVVGNFLVLFVLFFLLPHGPPPPPPVLKSSSFDDWASLFSSACAGKKTRHDTRDATIGTSHKNKLRTTRAALLWHISSYSRSVVWGSSLGVFVGGPRLWLREYLYLKSQRGFGMTDPPLA